MKFVKRIRKMSDIFFVGLRDRSVKLGRSTRSTSGEELLSCLALAITGVTERDIRGAIARVSRTCAHPPDSWARWDHIAHNGVADSKKREKGKAKREREEETEATSATTRRSSFLVLRPSGGVIKGARRGGLDKNVQR